METFLLFNSEKFRDYLWYLSDMGEPLAHWICKSLSKRPYTEEDSLDHDMFTLDSDPF